ncbi:MAG: hypothetical protein OEW59_09085, partial [Gammaproteobacteria bacterium]|nr:hypothetical protein [Gammaproteobacteria bacterium]
ALAMLLVGAQLMVATHALEHDAGNAQSTVCAACVAAGQLNAVAVDSGALPGPMEFSSIRRAAPAFRPHTTDAPAARQRGPPATV